MAESSIIDEKKKYLDYNGLTEVIRNLSEIINNEVVQNGKLVIKRNGIIFKRSENDLTTFSANQIEDVEYDILVPENLGDLNNVINDIQNIIKYGQSDVSELTEELKQVLEELQSEETGYLKSNSLDSLLEDYLKDNLEISYNPNTKNIELNIGNTLISYFSASNFIKDGMVTNVKIEDVTIEGNLEKCLIVTFNTDAEIDDVAIPLKDIFNSREYYTKSEINSIISNTISNIDSNGQEYVDLGLPSGILWSKMNVGASSEEDYGNYYMYGKGDRQYDSSDEIYRGIENPLDYSADTARLVMGGSWHIPTIAQFDELKNNTTYEWTTINNINGVKFIASNGNYIFFPANGSYSENEPYYVGVVGTYWTSTCDDTYVGTGIPGIVLTVNGSVDGSYLTRSGGIGVRGVLDKGYLISAEEKTKLETIEPQADVTDSENVKSALETGEFDGTFLAKDGTWKTPSGQNGKSAYQSYVDTTLDNPIKTESEWIESLHGQNGVNGTNGTDGQNGITPYIDPTTKHWMIGETDTNVLAEGTNGLNGTNGTNGKSAYEIYVDNVPEGETIMTEVEWLESLNGGTSDLSSITYGDLSQLDNTKLIDSLFTNILNN